MTESDDERILLYTLTKIRYHHRYRWEHETKQTSFTHPTATTTQPDTNHKHTNNIAGSRAQYTHCLTYTIDIYIYIYGLYIYNIPSQICGIYSSYYTRNYMGRILLCNKWQNNRWRGKINTHFGETHGNSLPLHKHKFNIFIYYTDGASKKKRREI